MWTQDNIPRYWVLLVLIRVRVMHKLIIWHTARHNSGCFLGRRQEHCYYYKYSHCQSTLIGLFSKTNY